MSVTLTPNIGVGKAVAISCGGALAYAQGGNIARTSKGVDVANARSGGFDQWKAGRKGASLKLDCCYNGDDPPAIVEGMEITVIFDSVGYEVSESIENASTTPTGRLITGQFFVETITDTWQSGDSYGWSLDAKSTGPYTVVETATGATPTT